MSWPGTADATQGVGAPWGESIALVIRAGLAAGSAWKMGPDPDCRLDDGNVLGPAASGSPSGDEDDQRLWVSLHCDTMSCIVDDGSTTSAGVFSRDEAATCSLELYDPGRQYDPLNSSGPYWYRGRSRLIAGVPVEVVAEVLDPGGATVTQFLLFRGTVDTWEHDIEQQPSDRRALVTASGAVKQMAALDYGPEPAPVGAAETFKQRVDRLLARFAWQGSSEQYGATSTARLSADDLDGPLWEQLNKAADAEIGYVHVTPLRDVRLFTREWWFAPLGAPSITLGCSPDVPDALDVLTDTDLDAADKQLRNAVYASREGGPTVIARSAASIAEHGGLEASYRKSDLELDTDVKVGEWADTVVVLYAYPEPTVATLHLLPAVHGETDGAVWRAVLAVNIMREVVRVLWTPPLSAPLDVLVRVNAIHHEITPTSWRVRWGTLAATRTGANVWTMGPHARDRLDDGNVIGWRVTPAELLSDEPELEGANSAA